MNREEYLMNVIPEAWAAVTGAKKRVQGMQQAADAAGIAHKAKQPDAPEAAQKAVFTDMEADMQAFLDKYFEGMLPENAAKQMVKMGVQMALQDDAPPEEVEPEPEPPVEDMATDGEDDELDEETLPLDEDGKPLRQPTKAHNHTPNSAVEKQTALLSWLIEQIPAMQEQQAAVTKGLDGIAVLTTTVQTLASKVEKMDAQLRMRPKASAAQATLLDESKLDAALKEVMQQDEQVDHPVYGKIEAK